MAKPAPKRARTKPAGKRVAAKPKRVAAKPGRGEWPRDPALEQAIIDAPLDPVPRMVYADWLQAAGDRRGEWMALHAAIESDRIARSAASDGRMRWRTSRR